MATLVPRDVGDLIEAVCGAAAHGHRLEIVGGASKAGIGRARDCDRLAMTAFAGIHDHDPSEMILIAGAGTPLADIVKVAAGAGQRLAFEPWDHGPIFGHPAGGATIGGVIAAAVAGPRRLVAGGPRDHLLGFEAVSGRGERFVAGGRVVKNVTGFDLSKLMAGSWGRLAAMTKVTLRLVPAPLDSATLVLRGLTVDSAIDAMARAMGSQAEVVAAAHRLDLTGRGETLLRLHGFPPSIEARLALLRGLLGSEEVITGPQEETCWREVCEAHPLRAEPWLWRVQLAPSRAAAFIERMRTLGMRWLTDWAGGLVWLGGDIPSAQVRAAVAEAGGHAMIVRAGPDLGPNDFVIHPLPSALAALETRIRRAFDPLGVFETGRFEPACHAD